MNSIVCSSDLLKKFYLIRKIEIHYAKKTKELGLINFNKLKKIIKYFFLLLKELLFFKTDLVYFQISPLGIAFYRDVLFISLIKIFQIRILFHLHGLGINKEVNNNVIKKMLYKYSFKNEYIICLAESVSSDIQKVYDNKPYIVYNGIKEFNVKKKSEPNKIPRILFLSNLLKSKGIIDFISALEKLDLEEKKFEVIIIGEERDVRINDILEKIKSTNLKEKINFKGPVYGFEKIDILLNSDILVHPTYRDNFPLVLIEAMQAGIPIISTNVGAISEIVKDKIHGFIINPGDIDALANCIKLLLLNSSLRKNMSKSLINYYKENFKFEVFEKNMLSVFNTILGNQ